MPERNKTFTGVYQYPLTTKHTRRWDHAKYHEDRPKDLEHAIGKMINGTSTKESARRKHFAYIGELGGPDLKVYTTGLRREICPPLHGALDLPGGNSWSSPS